VRWSYTLRNRERWNTQRDAVLEQQKAMSALAGSLGLTNVDFEHIAEAGIVEVDIPWTREDQDWELRIFPWEFLLATATHERRSLGKQPLTVVRRLRRETPPEKPARSGPPTDWLQVVSAPGKLAQEYDFDGERRLLELAADGRFRSVRNPDESALRREIADPPGEASPRRPRAAVESPAGAAASAALGVPRSRIQSGEEGKRIQARGTSWRRRPKSVGRRSRGMFRRWPSWR
jgi:hypothetical protein